MIRHARRSGALQAHRPSTAPASSRKPRVDWHVPARSRPRPLKSEARRGMMVRLPWRVARAPKL
eukprot:466506-Alexandrium_andersonii.AAC.1